MHRRRRGLGLLAAALLAAALAGGRAAAQSSREEAWRWCERRDAAIARDTQIAGCTWLIRSGRETTENLAIAFHNRGNARHHQRDYAGAIADYNEAIRLNPRDAIAFNNRGVARHHQRDYAGAIADYTEAIRLNPGDANALAARGLLRLRAGQAEAGRADIAAAIQAAGPDRGYPHAARAGLALLRGDLPAARADLPEASSESPTALALRAILRQREGNSAGAAADAAAARRLWPPIAESLAAFFGPGLALP